MSIKFNTLCPDVFDAGLPVLSYEFAETPLTCTRESRRCSSSPLSRSGPTAPKCCHMNLRERFCVTHDFRFRPG
jgi:hypothetical protein